MSNWAVGLKVVALVALVLAAVGVAVGTEVVEALLVLAALPAVAALVVGVRAFLDLDR
ncbi:hypothetical protein IS481_08040 [Caldimonas thermodepolymerans]|jgi:hypothetical protein|uniref:Uncharacterized protein n=1 Tax=Caldimonas thermodepolymerans TaxID=215580 RepID=A0AA46DI58_9BURK|nr:hypothetical protein [Caldimonas thermodepolymerans]QPC33081.1 hypothetical protein IS481_08040 [Caldimonas thermodepolymerans]RDI03869.1 hypothetical protein DES46_101557 [Caldimonas thermodepolymerans]TCP09836.1 hypothetical protein EV676_101415 [Caldimonas thermodepolymerans]UZG45951.1 hypothetical protein ONZ46_08390 [Caldimonas thermodepolymerans]UZG49843.1 hypothetical protein ONS87_09555 [Caldimonas thermodepolymerans]